MGTRLDDGVDEVSRKEYMRKNRRRPIEETINELGEGRGVYIRERVDSLRASSLAVETRISGQY